MEKVKMPNVNFVVVFEKNNTFFAMPMKVNASNNLYRYFDKYYTSDGGKICIIQYVPTMKKALELSKVWNEDYKRNGTFNTWYS